MSMEQLLKDSLLRLKIADKSICYRVFCDKYGEDVLLDRIANVISNSASILILCNESLSDSTYLKLIKKIKLLCAEFCASILIYSRSDIAFLSEADGIYLDKNSISSHLAEHIIGPEKLICSEVISSDLTDTNSDFISDGKSLVLCGKRVDIVDL